jgi:exodeoxyribonuclease V gamma subunit
VAGLYLYQSNNLEKLAERFRQEINADRLSPLEREAILVQSIGMGRWLSLEMAEKNGVWAGYTYLYPNVLLDTIFTAAFSDYNRDELIQKNEMQWEIFKYLPSCSKNSLYESLQGYADEKGSLKLFQLSGKIADLFDQYITGRPEMVCAWDAEEAHYRTMKGWAPLEKDEQWQYELWRAVVCTRNKKHRAYFRSLLSKRPLDDAMLSKLPSRLSVFGVSTLFPFHFDLLEYLSQKIDVRLYVVSPSREYIADIQSASVKAKITRKLLATKISGSDSHLPSGNSLVASMGILARDFQRMLLERNLIDETADNDFTVRTNDSLLAHVQSDILDSITRTKDGSRPLIAHADDSLKIHSCYGPMREVETLYDTLLHLLNKKKDLEPRDILVMATDIDTYAPYIESVFGSAKNEGSKRFIPYSIADRNIRRQSTTIDAFKKILFLADERCSATSILDIASTQAVKEKFSFTDDGLEQISSLLLSARINWGMNSADREKACGVAFEENSWDFGVERLLLGYAAGSETGVYDGIAPAEGADDDRELFSSFLQLYRKLSALMTWTTKQHKPAEWQNELLGAIESFFAENDSNAWEISTLRRSIEECAEGAARASYASPVSLRIIADALFSSLDDHAAQYGFLNGRVTFCAMLPMRSIPFKVIYVLGLDDGIFPRATRLPAFDLMGKAPLTGDRSKRFDDRYIFLETIISAREHLFLSYNGRSPFDNSERSPSVCVSELLDYIVHSYALEGSSDDGSALKSLIVTEHKLHLFSQSYFLKNTDLFSYNRDMCSISKSIQLVQDVPSFIQSPLNVDFADELVLSPAELVAFFKNPSRYFCQRQLGMRFPFEEPVLDNNEPFECAFNDSVEIENDLLKMILKNETSDNYFNVCRAKGVLPPGQPGRIAYDEKYQSVQNLAERVKRFYSDNAGKTEIDLRIKCEKASIRIRGEIADVHGGIVRARLKQWKHDQLSLWIEHLCLCASGIDCSSIFLWGTENDGVALPPVNRDEACVHLASLLSVYCEGLHSPALFFPKTSFEYAKKKKSGASDEQCISAAVRVWQGNQFDPSAEDSRDVYMSLCFSEDNLTDARFAALASAVYEPLLDHAENVL